MKGLTMLLFGLFLFVGCGKSDDVPTRIEHIASPFQDFLGTWELESIENDLGFVDPTPVRLMVIEEDNDITDAFARGYFLEDGADRSDLTLELTQNERGIILKNRGIVFTCTYMFDGADRWHLDDSDPSIGTTISTWKR